MHALLQIGVKGFLTNPDALIRIKVEIDSNPIKGFDVESVYLREPLPISIRALKESSLFAGKTCAALYRAWKKRIKGRDWFDLVWFLRRNIPLNRRYLEECMRFEGQIAKDEILTEQMIKNLLKTKVAEINLDMAKEDVIPFLRGSFST